MKDAILANRKIAFHPPRPFGTIVMLCKETGETRAPLNDSFRAITVPVKDEIKPDSEEGVTGCNWRYKVYVPIEIAHPHRPISFDEAAAFVRSEWAQGKHRS